MNTRFSKISTRIRAALSAAVLALGTAVASAHPGHDLTSASPAHLLASPDHLITLALLGAGLLLSAMFVQRLLARRLMQCAGAAAILLVTVTVIGHLRS